MKKYIAFFLACLLLFAAACQKLPPVDNGGSTPGGTEQPGGNTEQPGGNTEQPGGNTEQPGGNTEQPGGNTEQPGGNTEQPGGNTEQPGGNTGNTGNSGTGTGQNPGGYIPSKPSEFPNAVTIRITAVGDNLLHDSVSYSAQMPDGSFDYSVLYTKVADVFRGSDIAFLNQEVMLTGQVSAYPSIAAKAECADALKALGFNVINLATNHTLDKGVSGLETCLQNIHARNFDAVTGAFRTEDESKTQIILEKQGIRFGFLAYTYGINGSGLPAGKKWMVAKIDEEKMRAEVAALRKECDYLIVSMHWGQEYQNTQNSTQEKQAKLLAELGVDLVIGSHPHVLQPAKWYDRPDGGKMYCTYSLGNFISNQRKWSTMLGGILDMTLEFDTNTGALMSVKDAGIIPTVTHYNYYTTSDGFITRDHEVLLLEDYTEDRAAAHGIKNWAGELSLSWLKKHAAGILGEHQRAWAE